MCIYVDEWIYKSAAQDGLCYKSVYSEAKRLTWEYQSRRGENSGELVISRSKFIFADPRTEKKVLKGNIFCP